MIQEFTSADTIFRTMTEGKRCESAHIYLLSFILPVVVLIMMFVGGWTAMLGIIITLILYPLLDVFLGARKSPG